MPENILLQTNFPDLKLLRRGKVRDVYDLGDSLLIVATDRISCFDVVLGCGIPHKGEVLTKISLFWFDYLRNICENHLLTADVAAYPPQARKYQDVLRGRSMLVKKAEPLAIECIVRGYLSGSGWKEYQKTQSVCGIRLPAGLKESEKLPQTIFTPSTKADVGHDINVDEAGAVRIVGKEAFADVRAKAVALYEKAIIIADTKFEFGLDTDGTLTLMDEVLTPDSSRFWPAESYQEGVNPPSYDKQFVRDWLEQVRIDGKPWSKTPPAPRVPNEVIARTAAKYQEALTRLTSS